MSLNMITTSNVKELLTGYCIEREQCGFEAYVVVRSEPRLRRVILHDAPSSDDEGTSFKKRTRTMLWVLIPSTPPFQQLLMISIRYI